MTTALTKWENSTLKWVGRPWWPMFAFWQIALLAICGLALLGLSIRDLCILDSGELTTQHALIQTLARGLGRLTFSMIFLFSALWAGALRHYGRMLRKLASKNET